MPNQKYDQTSTIMSARDWVGGKIYAFLMKDATFTAADHNLSDLQSRGALQVNTTEVQNKAVGPAGEALGLSAVFPVTPQGSPYQVILGWDRHTGDHAVLCFYSQDQNGDPIGLLNNGTLIVRPLDFNQATGQGPWFIF